MKLKTEIKYLAFRENLFFLLTSILSTWTWTFLTINLDKGNDRGLLTISGFTILTSIVLSLFLSKNKLINSLKLTLQFALVCILTFALSLTIGLNIVYLIGIEWIVFTIPVLILGVSFYFILRQLIAFPNNKLAFWTILFIPILTLTVLSIIQSYDSTFLYDVGIGFPIGIFLTSLFLTIGTLCREKTATPDND